MRAIFHSLLLGLSLCASVSVAQAQEYSAVPTAVEQIGDATLRDALINYSPNYNYLVRNEQVRAYVNIYQALHNTQPALTAQDTALLTQPRHEVYVVPAAPPVYYAPPAYYYPNRPGFSVGINIGGNRWNRPGRRPPPHFGPGRPRPPGIGHRPPRPR